LIKLVKFFVTIYIKIIYKWQLK